MTLSRRDEFAKAAMQSFIIKPPDIHDVNGRLFVNGVDIGLIASSRSYADALIAELDKTSSPQS